METKANQKDNVESIFGEVIYTYTRADALNDGVLVDVSKMAKEAGVTFPVALTRTVWDQYIVPSKETEELGQSIEGRLWDLIWMFRTEAKRTAGAILSFQVLFLMKGSEKPELVELKGQVGPGDHGEPVITVMLPNED